MNGKIYELLLQLRLKGMAEALDREIQKEGSAVSEFLQTDGRALREEINNFNNEFRLSRVVRPLPEKKPCRCPPVPPQTSLHNHKH